MTNIQHMYICVIYCVEVYLGPCEVYGSHSIVTGNSISVLGCYAVSSV